MSANTYTFTCIGSDAAALARLLALLQVAIQAPDAALPEPLDRFFEYWDEPCVTSTSLLGTTLRCTVDTSAHDPLKKPQVLAWHASGAEYLRVQVFNSQVGESATTYYHAGKRITAKAFPKPVLSEGERLYELVLEAKDGALANEVKAGASPNATADGVPIMVLALRAGLVKSVRALHDAGVDWSACLPWAAEVAELIGACGMVVSWTIGTTDAELVNTMVDAAIETVTATSDRPVVHSDRGGHYRWPRWLSRMSDANLTRSMSRKACLPDNAACEGFFGRLKNELFCPRDWKGTTFEQFIEVVDDYIRWYNEKRIKISLGFLSPVEYRASLGLAA
ncbi:transposase [Acidovorax sp. CF316]|nr:transposase [Acidovorax sp. CF316]